MRLYPRSLSGQLALLLLLALLVVQGASLALFTSERSKAVREVYRENLISRTAGLYRLIGDTPAALHDRVAKAASSRWLGFRVTGALPVMGPPDEAGRAERVAGALSTALALPSGKVRVGAAPVPDWNERAAAERRQEWDAADDELRRRHLRWHPRSLSIALALPDGRWLTARTGLPRGPRWGWRFLMMLGASALAVALVALLVGRLMTRPMRSLAEAADRLGRGEEVGKLIEAGPEETRRTIRAFNRMQERRARFLRDRMAMLAAISHDLRTPITSLRLRAEFIDDEEMKGKILETLDEMQAMTEGALDFIREEGRSDPGRPTDLLALVESTVVDFAETGRPAEFRGGLAVTLSCRPAALRRALRNLIENAIAYGGTATVGLEADEVEVRIVVEDAGPGIPPADLERVFDPFVRLEASRNRNTGGVGLGLAIARSIGRQHGGDVTLAARPGGGLRAVIHLPRETSDT